MSVVWKYVETVEDDELKCSDVYLLMGYIPASLWVSEMCVHVCVCVCVCVCVYGVTQVHNDTSGTIMTIIS